MPKTVTCRVLSTDMLKKLSNSLIHNNDFEQSNLFQNDFGEYSHGQYVRKLPPPSGADGCASLLLAGLHACGDLSVTMLR